MKVMCISNKYHTNLAVPVIPVGEIVTVTGQSIVHSNSWYILEYPCDIYGKKCSYAKRGFAPLSDIDETEIHEQLKEKETA